MSDKLKNIITNILGLIVVGASFFLYLTDKLDTSKFVIAILISLGLFMFKAPVLKDYLKKFLDKKLK